MEIEFVEYDREFLGKSSIWLSDSEIKWLTMAPEISKLKQIEWFNELKNREDYYIKGVTVDKVLIGAMGIKKIDLNSKKGESWLYIGEKDFWGKGIGYKMLEELILIAKKMGLHFLIAKVACDNHQSVYLHRKCGYKIVNTCLEDEREIYMLNKQV